MKMDKKYLLGAIATFCLTGFISGSATAQLANPWQNDGAEVLTEVSVSAFVEFEFIDPALLYLEIPPPNSTVPSDGVGFKVSGNASATVTAEPDAFIQVAGPENWLGKAVQGSEEIGYNIEVRFPRFGVPSSPVQIASLPGFEASPTNPLSVDLTLTGNEREGVIHLEANENWTAHGGVPFPGIYEGQITITVSADSP